MTDCKNCKMTDEYCASGDCPNDTLTEQWRKGELPSGDYYIRSGLSKYIQIRYLGEAFFEGNIEVIAPVPSYNEWKDTIEKYHLCIEANQSLRKRLDEEICKNKISYYDGSPMDYLDECERAIRKNKMLEKWIKNLREGIIKSGLREITEGNRFVVELLDKIDKVLK